MKRREVLKGLAATTAAMVTTQAVVAEEKKADGEEIVDYLFVQNSGGVSLSDGVLIMKNVATDTVYFSDRPERIAGRFTTQKFVDNWSVGEESFADVPPNAVLSIFDEPEPLDIVVELRNPRLTGDDLIYDVSIIDGEVAATGLASSLFIDVVGRPLTPMSVAGVSRRTARRTTRRVNRRN
ncbi:MAG: hypothetical protein DRR42_24440 [Gammaproteobacteria bacterium]|nr:MAG: hypothetical protein DRR42_24440 [Gammaproteobacteria bacterium]